MSVRVGYKRRAAGLAALLMAMPVIGLADPMAFKIDAGPAEDSLAKFGQQAGLQMFYTQQSITGHFTKAVVGQYEPRVALEKLLKNSGLTYQFANDHTVTISSGASHAPAHAGANPTASAPPPDRAPLQVAQRESATDASNSAAPAAPVLDEVIVTAQKRPERLQNVPISMSVLGGTQLDRSTGQGVTEALTAVAGVAVQENYLGGGTIVAIRGVAPAFATSAGSSPVAYYLDSVPFGLVKAAIAPDSSAFDLERVEVLRGPQGTLYGASALNGVVRILSHDADLNKFDFKARISDSGTQYGGNNYRGDAAINVPLIPGTLAARAVVGYTSNSGWIDQANASNVNDTQLATYRIKLNAQPTPELSIGLSAWSSHDHAGAPSVGSGFDRSDSEVLNQPVATNFNAYSARIGYQFPWVSVVSSTSYLDYKNFGTLGLDVAPFGTPELVGNSVFIANESSHLFAQEVNFNSSLEGPWHWSAGGIYRKATEIRFAAYTGVFGIFPYTLPYDTSKSYALYGELTRELFDDRLEITAGARHFHDDITQEEQLGAGTAFIPDATSASANTPRLVLTWHVSPEQMVYASYAQGFRSGFPQDAVVPAAANIPAAAPDRLRNYEIGSKGTSNDGMFAYDASVYYMLWQGIQQTLSVSLPELAGEYVAATVNSQSASGVGADLALAFHPIPDLTLKASASWNDLEMDSTVFSNGGVLFHKGDRPNSSPETTANLAAEYRFQLGSSGLSGRAEVSGTYTSSMAYRGVGSLDAPMVQDGDPMVLTHASFAVDFQDHWTATLYGDNLNNERGAPVKAFVGAPNWNARIRPRTIGLQLEYHLR